MKSWLVTVAIGLLLVMIAAIGKRGLRWWEAPTRNRRLTVAAIGIAFIFAGLFWRV
jgi:hypothetical protein